jgi:spore germination protein KB
LIAIAIGLKGTDMTASLILIKGLNASWMIIFGSFLVVLPSLIILNFILKKQQSKNLFEIIQLGFGKYISFFIVFIFFIYLLLNISTDSRSYTDQLITMNLPKTPLFVLYLLLLLVCIWCAKKGWESLDSVAWMIYPYVIIAFVILFILLAKEVSLMRLFPLFRNGIGTIAKESFHYASIYGELFAIAFMYPFVKDHQTYTKSIVISSVYCVILIVLFHISYALVFDFRSVEKITYPFSEATRLISVGKVITNVETFFLTFWALCVVIKFALLIYLNCKIFGFLFHIKESEQLIFPITILILIIGMIPENEVYNIFVVRKLMFFVGTFFYLTLPPVLWITLKVKGVLKN